MSPQGPLFASTCVDGGNGGRVWTNPSYGIVEDGNLAYDDNIGPGGGATFPNQLIGTGFGFSIPSTAVIDGIKLEIKASTTDEGGGSVNDSYDGGGVYLVYSGGQTYYANTPNAGQFWPSTGLTWLTYGGPTSTWGRTWTPAQINNAAFGASMSASAGHSSSRANIDSHRITVYWHTGPANVPKRYQYKVSNNGQYLGNIPNVTSQFAYGWDINTLGTNLNIEVAVSPDTSILPVSNLTDEQYNQLTDESLNPLTTEGQAPLVALGLSGSNALIRNGNELQVIEFSYFWPQGKVVFQGEIIRWEASYGGTDRDTIKVMAISDGQDLDNYIARGSPFTYTLDQSQTSQNSSGGITSYTKGGAFAGYGQSFTVGVGVTNISAINIYLNGSATVNITLSSMPPGFGGVLGSITQNVTTSGAQVVQFAFPAPITVTPGTQYFFSVETVGGGSITIYYQNTAVYSGGTAYYQNYGGGGGGGWGAITGDLYFQTFSGTGSTLATYTSQDPATGILIPVLNDYIARGGQISATSGSTVIATGLSITYTFNTNTVYEALNAMLSVSPQGYYYYVDIATDILYFKPVNTTADFTLIKGKHIQQQNTIASIENVKNQVFFSGGLSGSTNIYVQRNSASSINAYGLKLDRKSDNRVTDTTTAGIVALADLAANSKEGYQTTVTVADRTIDITLFKPGNSIGFAGFGNYMDNIIAMIVHIDYTPEYVTLTLGSLPKRINLTIEQINRGLIASQTVQNPSTPS